MKKRLIGLLTMMMVALMFTSAFAADRVEVKTNSDPITAASDACEKIGSMSFTFDAGTVLRDGDYFYADLPLGVTLCKSFNFALLNDGAVAGVLGGPLIPATLAAVADGATRTIGAITVKDLGTDAAAGGVTVVPGGAATGVWFKVQGTAGSSRVLITVMDDESTLIETDAGGLNSNGNSTVTVDADVEFSVALFDTLLYAGELLRIDSVTTSATFGEYVVAPVAPDNSLCVTVGASYTGDNTIEVSISSMSPSTVPARPNFLTFNPTNPEVAHKVAAIAIQLDACKGDTMGYVSLTGGQAAVCTFDYETPVGYCPSIAPAAFVGNQMIITSTVGNFGQAGDQYKVVTSIDGNGSYFGANSTVNGFTSLQDPCAVAGVGVGATTSFLADGITAPTAFATGTGCAVIPATSQAVKQVTGVMTINTYNRLALNLGSIVYDPAAISDGDQVEVTVELQKLPCGKVFSAKRVIAQYVTTCASTAPTTTLLYPYATPLSGSDGWWFGMSIVNPSLAAGTATVTVVEDDGDKGTFTSAAIASQGMVTWGNADLLNALTADPANTGTLGDARANISVQCGFADGAGFGMMGNGTDSTGFTPYTTSNTWNN